MTRTSAKTPHNAGLFNTWGPPVPAESGVRVFLEIKICFFHYDFSGSAQKMETQTQGRTLAIPVDAVCAITDLAATLFS
jgi:hypothetical protein